MTGVQTCALPIFTPPAPANAPKESIGQKAKKWVGGKVEDFKTQESDLEKFIINKDYLDITKMPGEEYSVQGSTCSVAQTARVKVYPDIKWTFKGEYSYKYESYGDDEAKKEKEGKDGVWKFGQDTDIARYYDGAEKKYKPQDGDLLELTQIIPLIRYIDYGVVALWKIFNTIGVLTDEFSKNLDTISYKIEKEWSYKDIPGSRMVGIKSRFKFESDPFIKVFKKSLYENDKFLTELFGKIPGLSQVFNFTKSLGTGMLNAINPLKSLVKIPDKKVFSGSHKFGIELYGSIGFSVETIKEPDAEQGKSEIKGTGEIGIEFKLEAKVGIPLLSLSSGIEASIKPKIYPKPVKDKPGEKDHLAIMFSGIRFEYAAKITKNSSVKYKKDNPKPDDPKPGEQKKDDKYQIIKEMTILKLYIYKDRQPPQTAAP